MLFAANNDFNERETLFVEVILPLSLSINYTYRIPFELNHKVAVGKRVVVQFGRQKIYTALIKSIGQEPPKHYQAKYIIDVVDERPIVSHKQFAFWNWLTSYYLCNEGEVMNAALPTGLKLASETIIQRQDHSTEEPQLNEKEQKIYAILSKQKTLTVNDIVKFLGQKNVHPIINGLLAKGIIIIVEKVVEKYKPLLKSFIGLNSFYKEEENLKQLFTLLEGAPKQLDALLAYLKLSKNSTEVMKQQVLESGGCSQPALKALIDKDVFWVEKRSVSRLDNYQADFDLKFSLSAAQQKAFHAIENQFHEKQVVLLHGVTSSGKTQLYIKFIEKILEKGGQVLFLLPEIVLTTQIVHRIKRCFGDKIGVYHSKFNDHQRVEIWNKVLNGSYQVVLGARSSIFLPFCNLKLVVIDEEHESSYKQHEPAPRYQARDSAIVLARLHQAKVLLGSATPAIETYFNVQNGKYGLVELTERFGGVQLPLQEVVCIADEIKQKKMTSYFTGVLLNNMTETLKRKEQVILFQNRRGYATILICVTCGYTPKCVNCDVSLTYHKSSGRLHCHYCGYHQNSLRICPACGSVHIEQKGFGTERIEEELNLIFPDIKISRLDLDSARTKNGMQQIIADFQDKKTDVLIGTQMVTKGLDFDHVSLIGVINADTLLNYPDFRAFERSFQLLVQVAGRSGRRDKQGKVCIQTYNKNHRIIKQVVENDYQAMYQNELAERQQYLYPPYARLIFLILKHKNADKLDIGANALANMLRQTLGSLILGPQQPPVARIRNYYIQQISIKAERNISIQKVKEILTETITNFNTETPFKGIIVQIDVDPY